jgi:hypothetical protein
MVHTLIIIGLFATVAMIFAGGKIIMHLVAIEKKERKTLKRKIHSSSENYITVKKDVLVALLMKNEDLNKALENALSNYKKGENDLNFIINYGSDTDITERYFNTSYDLNPELTSEIEN